MLAYFPFAFRLLFSLLGLLSGASAYHSRKQKGQKHLQGPKNKCLPGIDNSPPFRPPLYSFHALPELPQLPALQKDPLTPEGFEDFEGFAVYR